MKNKTEKAKWKRKWERGERKVKILMRSIKKKKRKAEESKALIKERGKQLKLSWKKNRQ